jgi:hypothetical protein
MTRYADGQRACSAVAVSPDSPPVTPTQTPMLPFQILAAADMATTDDNSAAAAAIVGGALMFILLIAAIPVLISLIGMWKVFSKAGQPGWAAIIPIYNTYVLIVTAGKPGWWLLLFLIPFVNLVILILVLVGLAANFGKGVGFAIGLLLRPFIFYPILGFGSAKYQGAAA